MKKYFSPIMTETEADALAGRFITPGNVKKVIMEDVDLYDRESGRCLAILRRGVIPGDVQERTFQALHGAATPTLNRATAASLLPDQKQYFKIRKNGLRAKTHEAPPVDSGIVGYFDRNPRMPYCRLTAFTAKNFSKFKSAYPIVSLVDQFYKNLRPTEYQSQNKITSQTSSDFVIPGTVFTTVTVNKNYRTAVHKDSGDFKGGFGNLVALRKGYFEGGVLCLVRWGVGFDLQNGDLLLMDVHQWHANTEIKLIDPKAVRLSLVMYYRENMVKCGSAQEELKRVRNRKKGDKL